MRPPDCLLLAPTVNTLRHPGWGRSQETYGEDPFHLGAMGAAFTRGVQTEVPACVKHLAGNNIEDTRMTNNAVIDEQSLRESYLRQFRTIVREADVACVMSAYNMRDRLGRHTRVDRGFPGHRRSAIRAAGPGPGPARWSAPGTCAAPSAR